MLCVAKTGHMMVFSNLNNPDQFLKSLAKRWVKKKSSVADPEGRIRFFPDGRIRIKHPFFSLLPDAYLDPGQLHTDRQYCPSLSFIMTFISKEKGKGEFY